MSTPRASLRLLGLLSFIGLTSLLPAQSILVQEPASTATPRVIPPSAGTPVNQTPGVEFGRVRLRPQAYVRYMHAEGVPIGVPTLVNSVLVTEVDTDILTLSAGLGLELGDHWLINYTPTWVNYSASQLRDSVNQSLTIDGATLTNDWDLRLSGKYDAHDDVLAETAQQTEQRTWQGSISAAHPVGQRSRYEGVFGVVRDQIDFDNPGSVFVLPDTTTETWSTDQWFSSQFTPKFNAGVGVSLGWLELQSQPDMRFDRYLGKITWKPTEKITLTTQGGTESRHSGGNSLHSPIILASLDYRPLEFTNLTIGWQRNTSHSPITNQLTKNKGWSIAASQRFLGKLLLSLTYAETDSDYTNFGTSTVILPVRSDEVRTFNGTLSVLVLQRCTVSAIYQDSRNASSDPRLDFSTQQYGLELRIRY